MLPRTLEPEAMDSPDEAREYDQMDHRQVNQLFARDLLATGTGPGAILDVGTGTAQIPVELCRREPAAVVLAVDVARAMLQLGTANVVQAGLAPRIHLAQVDARRLPLAAGAVGCVMSNSIVHHLADPRPVLAEAVRVCAPGGRLFFRDLLRPPDESTWQHLVHCYAGNAAPGARQLFAQSLLAALTLEEVRALVAELGYEPAGVQASSDRHWTWSARR